uniref:histidine kinase n=1 Tax=Eiseniibacteriota bacterium TaxID=2212470 RepID=A0A832I0W2_UNCEI
MDRLTVELSALAFQNVFTLLLAFVYFSLWRRQRRAYFLTWALAWSFYALRLVCISAFLVLRHEVWLFLHQAVTGISAMLLLFAALQFSRGARWRPAYLWIGVLAVAWAAIAIFGIHSMAVAGITSSAILSGVTLWTGWVFWRHRSRAHARGGALLAVTFVLWGLHHLDYPILRPLGAGVLWGVFADILFIMSAAIGTMFLVLNEGRRALEARTQQLEQLTRLLLRAQEDERRRIARELHDEAGQVLTAVKIELDLEGRKDASEMVGRALDQVRNLSNLLRPTVLDDLGLSPALRRLVEDFARRTQIAATLEGDGALPALDPEVQVAIYRVVQEALTNVARHARARAAWVRLAAEGDRVRLTVEDDGLGLAGEPTPHLGMLGMRERVTELGGTFTVEGRPGAGVRIAATLPRRAAA